MTVREWLDWLFRDEPLRAFGADDIGLAILAPGQDLFSGWVILNEHKWVILAERRSRGWAVSVPGYPLVVWKTTS